ncbi:hypothetical protein B9Z55_016135 [Caenorhabditis nigoni]|uniref:Pre-mRNA-splicing factor 38 n=1 Tax=Caenorhabditis nigoni TaxID=1611254 RepID=A0A2G5UDB3_9PELO|nr:hypothetical protein B9Z55_016135 [Caenorhabditis nigoni]
MNQNVIMMRMRSRLRTKRIVISPTRKDTAGDTLDTMDMTQAADPPHSDAGTVPSVQQKQQQVQDAQATDHPQSDARRVESVHQLQEHAEPADAENHREVCQDSECTCVSLAGHKSDKRTDILPLWGDHVTMNLSALVLENVTKKSYYKNVLLDMESFPKLLEQIISHVKHLEPWDNYKRSLQGMTETCGGGRVMAVGVVVSSAYCLLYRLFNLRITRKQLFSMLKNRQSVYVRAMGLMYIRYTQPPGDLWYWMEPFLDDDSEIDPRSGGGDVISFGQMVKLMINKLDWYGTLFPRIPDRVQEDIVKKLAERKNRMEQEKRQEGGEQSSSGEGNKSSKGRMVWTCTACNVVTSSHPLNVYG